MKENKKVYEVPMTEVVVMNSGLTVLMASVPEVGLTGSGFQFGTGEGSW